MLRIMMKYWSLPWYGFFGIVLREYMSRVEDNVATLFIPQLPITVEVDDIDIDDNDASGDRDEEDHDTDDGGYESPTHPLGPLMWNLSTSLTEQGGIYLMFDISLLIDVSQNQFAHGPTTEEKSTVPEGSKSARFSRESVRGRLPTLTFYASS